MGRIRLGIFLGSCCKLSPKRARGTALIKERSNQAGPAAPRRLWLRIDIRLRNHHILGQGSRRSWTCNGRCSSAALKAFPEDQGLLRQY
jgi:hypothetical protein